jgi:hypothetical protein
VRRRLSREQDLDQHANGQVGPKRESLTRCQKSNVLAGEWSYFVSARSPTSRPSAPTPERRTGAPGGAEHLIGGERKTVIPHQELRLSGPQPCSQARQQGASTRGLIRGRLQSHQRGGCRDRGGPPRGCEPADGGDHRGRASGAVHRAAGEINRPSRADGPALPPNVRRSRPRRVRPHRPLDIGRSCWRTRRRVLDGP